ncbi:MAG: OmpH family outer membrane protein [Pseudomonadota bacterium]
MSQRLAFFVTLMVALCAPAFAADGARIGFVNLGYLIDNSPQAEAAKERLELEFQPRQREVAETQGLLDALRAEAAEAEENSEQLVELQRRIVEIERRLVRTEQAFREDLNIQRNIELRNVREKVLLSVDEFATAQGFDVILTDGVVFASERIDVTERLLQQLREQN